MGKTILITQIDLNLTEKGIGDILSDPDPFFKLWCEENEQRIEGTKYTSSHVMNECHPSWNLNIERTLHSKTIIHIKIYDWDIGFNDFLGQVIIPSSSLKIKENNKRIYEYNILDGHDLIGTLSISVTRGYSTSKVGPYTKYTSRNNFGLTQRWLPRCTFYPYKKKHLIEIINLGKLRKKKIRCIAGGHSWTAICVSKDYLIDVQDLNKIEIDEELLQIKIEPGVTVKQLSKVFKYKKWCIGSNVVLTSVMYGGIITSGCHGTGNSEQILSDYVVNVELILHDGRIVNITQKGDDLGLGNKYGISSNNLFNAAILSFGCLGVVASYTIQVKQDNNVLMIDRKLNLSTILNPLKLKSEVLKYQGVQIFWWPYTDQVWFKSYDNANQQSPISQSELIWSKIMSYIGSKIGSYTLKMLIDHPKLVPNFTHLINMLIPSYKEQVLTTPDSIHYQKGIDKFRTMQDVEFIFPVDEHFENVSKCWSQLIDLLDQYRKNNKYPLNLVVEMRFTRGSSALLSPAYFDEHQPNQLFCYLEFLTLVSANRKHPSWKIYGEFARDIVKKWLDNGIKIIPHWAKGFIPDIEGVPNMMEQDELNIYLHQTFGQRLTDFMNIQKKLDPSGVFLNEHFNKLFK